MKSTVNKHPTTNMNDDQKKHEYPVIPLIIPNNCIYDNNTNTMSIDTSKSRNELKVYPEALKFIRNIRSKIATISIAGRARTGKSLVAGELYAPQYCPCPFDLGHTMDACTYGIWVSAQPISHPHKQDTVILILDVEGTGFHENTKHNDMQIMVITLLISSYFIYNTRGTFTSSALDELEFVTELADRIQLKPNDEEGIGLEYILPKFMWLLRDVHLESTIDNQKVCVKDYFTCKVLKYEKGKSKVVQKRQSVRSVFMQTFREYDAYTLAMPHAKKEMLSRLGSINRDELQPEFNEQLTAFCDKVVQEASCKVLFIQTQNESDDNKEAENEEEELIFYDDEEEKIEIDQYIRCRGSHLAGWIEECVKYVNDPDKVPQISSMTASVMANVFRESKTRAIKQYEQLLFDALKELRAGEKALEEKDIIDLHCKIWNEVLNESGLSLQSFYNNIDGEKSITADRAMNEVDKEQFKVYFELCHEIGHNNDVTKIGKTGILNQVLVRNHTLSTKACETYLDEYFNDTIKPLLDEPEMYQATEIMEKWKQLYNEYYLMCGGPAKQMCWIQFENERKHDSIEQFKKMKGYSDELAQQQIIVMAKAQQVNDLEMKQEILEAQKQQQKQIYDEEIVRINAKSEEQRQEFEVASGELQKKANDARLAMWVDIGKSLLNTGVQCYFMHQKNKRENKKVVQLEKQQNKIKRLEKRVKGMDKKVNKMSDKNPPQMHDNREMKSNDDYKNDDIFDTFIRYGIEYGPAAVETACDCLTQ